MIAKNLSKSERILRLLLGLVVAGLVIARPEMRAIEWTGTVISLFLILNGIFGRCYLWHVLEISSCGCNPFRQQGLCDKTSA